MSVRHLGVLALITAGVLVLVSDLRPVSARFGGEVIAGPYSYLLASSTDLGPSLDSGVQLTMALRDEHRPTGVYAWADGHGLSVRWRPGHPWAVVEGPAASVADAFDVEVRDYRGRRGQVFYASPQQPDVPDALREEVSEIGRILGYVPHHRSHIWSLPLDVPDKGLTPEALRNTYNAAPLAAAGYTGKGTTIVFFAFDGFDQADLDSFADTYDLPRFTPEVIGELDEPRGEATMDLQVAHAVAPDARKVVVSALPTVTADGAFERIGQMLEETDRRYPGAVWSFSIGWGCDRLITAADLAPVRSALATAQSHGTTAFNASGDLAGLECKGGDDWSSPPGESDVGLDSIASLPEMTDVGGTTLSTDSDGRWLSEQAWFDVPLSVGTGGGVSAVFDRPDWQREVWPDRDTDRRLTPDVAAVADPFTGVRIVFAQTPLVGGGTSQSAPIWAGLAAVMNQYLLANGGRPLGDLNPLLYRISRGAPLPAFRDVTLGGNAVADALPGYDLVTGLGTPDVDNLVRNVLTLQKAAA
ncbi:protease pro-enzyme activation domain-containing protein [Mycobacterium sp. 852014-52144_SCH5372336]|uniref:S53 family peptidase n=1 Tax=Mycobacterium sp. 852014-52144_SCH5372336 TaxID=1834115 RepID=UPI000A8B9CD4|nr:S53 family peptidase [Mycobacterium sp. 852014-52144_SCH5372336]